MQILLIIIMAIAAVMLILYFIALLTKDSRVLIAFRVTMLILIATLLISWIVSLITGQHLHLLLVMAAIFIVMYILS